MRTVKILERAVIGGSPSQLARDMGSSESISRFPGVVRAFVGQAGVRVDLAVDTLPLRDSIVVAWWTPQIQDARRTYRFGLEGGRWINGIGRIDMDQISSDETEVSVLWEIDLATQLALIPGLGWVIGRWLRRSTRVWLGRMKWLVESSTRRKMSTLTLADVGA